MREVAVIGIGITKFGELWDMSFREIGIRAGLEAVYDANLSGEEIDGLFVGNMSAGRFIDQEHVGALIADYGKVATEVDKESPPSTEELERLRSLGYVD